MVDVAILLLKWDGVNRNDFKREIVQENRLEETQTNSSKEVFS